MKKLALFSLLTNIPLFAEKITTSDSMSISLLWLILSLLIVVLFFWGMYKVIITKNPKYGYVILLAGVLMLASVFI